MQNARKIAILAMAGTLALTSSAYAATYGLKFQGERVSIDDTFLPIAAGPVYRRFDAVQSIAFSFAYILSSRISARSTEERLADGQATVRNFPVIGGTYFQMDAFFVQPLL